jgi:hypothetical protein
MTGHLIGAAGGIEAVASIQVGILGTLVGAIFALYYRIILLQIFTSLSMNYAFVELDSPFTLYFSVYPV